MTNAAIQKQIVDAMAILDAAQMLAADLSAFYVGPLAEAAREHDAVECLQHIQVYGERMFDRADTLLAMIATAAEMLDAIEFSNGGCCNNAG